MAIPILALNDVLQIVHAYSVDNQTCLNVFHYRIKTLDTTPNRTYIQQLADVAEELVLDPVGMVQGWAAMAAANAQSVFMQVQRIHPTRNPYYRRSTNTVGAIAGVSAPSICALSITKRTEQVGRGRSGHTQLGGLPVGDLLNGKWEVNSLNRAEDYADWMLLDLLFGQAGQIEPVIYREAGNPYYARLIACNTNQQVRTMHRRTVGLGI